LTSNAGSESVIRPELFPRPPVTPVETKAHSHTKRIARSESVSTSQPSGSSAGSDSQGFLSHQRRDLDEPHMGQGVKPAPVPLSGFLNPSAVSWQAQVPRPYFVPQPFPGFSPPKLSPRENRAPLSGPHAPLRLSTCVRGRTPRVLITARFTNAHAFTQLPGSPDDYAFPFHAPSRRFHEPRSASTSFEYASRSAWVSSSRTVPSHWLHPLRSLDPPASPFAPPRVAS